MSDKKKSKDNTTKNVDIPKTDKSKNKENVEKDLKKIKQERNLTDDEIVEINRLLEKISNSEKKIIINRKDINKRTVFHVIRKIFFSYILYFVIYFAMFGLFSRWFKFRPSYLIFFITLGYAAYMVLVRYLCRLITEKTSHYISIYNIFSLISVLVIYETGKLVDGYTISGFIVIVSFYYISEILITILRQYLFKYLPSKIRWGIRK